MIVTDHVNLNDVWIVELCHAARFAQESLNHLRVMRQRFAHQFDRDVAVQIGLETLVNHAHAAPAKLFNDIVMSNLATHDLLLIKAKLLQVISLGRNSERGLS